MHKLSDDKWSTLDENLGEDGSKQGDVFDELFSDYNIVVKNVLL